MMSFAKLSQPSSNTGRTGRTGLLLLFLLCVCCLPQWAFAELSASVDRKHIGLNETFTLTIRLDESSLFSGPDLKGLLKDFEILNQQQSSRHTIINGKSSATTEWQITLEAKRAGNLVIPPIEVSGQKTQPLAIVVSPQSTQQIPGNSRNTSNIYMEAELDAEKVYVQSQVLFTVRAIASFEPLQLEFAEPELDGAFVEQIEDSNYYRTINGQKMFVREVTYALFPQQSGTLNIPEVKAEAVVPIRQNRRSLFDSFTNQGKILRIQSAPARLQVLEPPAGQTAKLWLPAKQLRLSESWSEDPADLKVGQSLTRSITIEAEGLLAEQLPPLDTLAIDGIKSYPEQAQTESNRISGGVQGVRVESTALIPTRPGDYTLPAITIDWWNTRTNSAEQARLPARHIQVHGASLSQTQATTPTTTPGATSDTVSMLAADNAANSASALGWQISTLALAATSLLFAVLYLRARQHPPAATHSTETAGKTHNQTAKSSLSDLQKACLANDPHAARHALQQWALSSNPRWHTLEDLAQSQQGQALGKEIRDLEQHLYGSQTGASSWQGSALWQAVSQLAEQHADGANDTPLAGLYPG